MTEPVQLHCGEALAVLRGLPSGSVQTCVTSPPFYGLRDYGTGRWEGGDEGCDHRLRAPDTTAKQVESSTLGGGKKTTGFQAQSYGAECGRCGARRVDDQIGLEPTPAEYVARLVEVFGEVRRVLRDDATLFLNLGDSFGPGKQLLGIPWKVAFALQDAGWVLRQDIVWAKPNPMPESVRDRCTKSHEYLFLLSKQARYFFDAEAIAEKASENSGWAKQRANGVNTWKYNDTPERVAATGQTVESSTLGTPGTRNKRSVFNVPAKLCRLRADLTEEQKQHVVIELIKRGIL